MWLPCLIQLALLLTGLAVLFHHVAPAHSGSGSGRRQRHEPDGEDAALVTAQLSEADELHLPPEFSDGSHAA